MTRSGILRQAMHYLFPPPEDRLTDVFYNVSTDGLCDAILLAADTVETRDEIIAWLFKLSGTTIEFERGTYWLIPNWPSSYYVEPKRAREAYSARIMLLEWAALEYEEERAEQEVNFILVRAQQEGAI